MLDLYNAKDIAGSPKHDVAGQHPLQGVCASTESCRGNNIYIHLPQLVFMHEAYRSAGITPPKEAARKKGFDIGQARGHAINRPNRCQGPILHSDRFTSALRVGNVDSKHVARCVQQD